ncbi:vitamin K-dependent gamma-carboxylase-like [Lytechinus variegatus]|uniref:vitamin K-dependent gamma-carboxylase-like n=1 Tax=Lytechinus variegatus TaxID=7654 RepID=UPI001BB29E09|nr:vitamin K-dependent gamma-carboxylase-like [Lytechinus variegatus]XP_041478310.1 vitamin K-dependent gamma-carboxylase-like [Lytechinus variegatus]
MPTKRRPKSAKGTADMPDTGRTPSASGDAPAPRQAVPTLSQKGCNTTMKSLLGFDISDISSWSSFVKLMNSPQDPASIAVWRILFGLVMMIDIPQERGMAYADYRWGDPNECRFPLFNALKPLPVDWMYVVYLTMYIGAFGVFLGAFYRLSCLLFCIPYWYIFFLDKTTWNNHSYLYGLISFQLIFMDANRFWSVDALLNPKIRNANIPLWNIAIIRFQIFVVYFYAGLKKLDADWIGGYSMEYLSKHWIFEPFRFMLTDEEIDYFIVHLGGLVLDLSSGFLLFFDATRLFATFFCSSFHIMNSQIFSIGMFPYAMLASTTVFFSPSWPRSFCSVLPIYVKNNIPSVSFSATIQPSENCIYPPPKKENKKKNDPCSVKRNSKMSWRHQSTVIGLIIYVCIQLFMPYSHFITKGYNNWTNGLYGYSWDMMVHSWHTQHVKLKYIDGKTGNEGYLSPDYWTESNRWAGHSDMTKQYATCIAHHLKDMGLSEPRLYMDVWKSMNGRFQQRMFNPNVDLVRANWSPFSATPWIMPLLTELSDWRIKLTEIEDQLDDELDITFVADFPGLYLENFISEDLGNTTIQVLSGSVMVELVERKRNITLHIGDRIQLPAGDFHNVHTVSDTPSCYMYVFVNTTEQAIVRQATDFFNKHEIEIGDTETLENTNIDPKIFEGLSDAVKMRILEKVSAKIEKNEQASRTIPEKAQIFLDKKKLIFHRTIVKTVQALNHIILGGESVVLNDHHTTDRTGQDNQKTHVEL